MMVELKAYFPHTVGALLLVLTLSSSNRLNSTHSRDQCRVDNYADFAIRLQTAVRLYR